MDSLFQSHFTESGVLAAVSVLLNALMALCYGIGLEWRSGIAPNYPSQIIPAIYVLAL